ncbi:heavy metal-responsive transcriptional regulator [Nocardiopsis suaedae]|uniref:Heavy metal-responsive transcriptional regulator n=1 Tax=Nocardiopsis suaedae TaxID=3018444 RepID=A0ABT4TGJ4_9ACTN|nr:heavy metal-responsive transcriptional regulator [Nocardiopsis suaedae]MDA2803389.1 heavy metal-responsive transcriptional regulator [Nocardiopsis suaedae]
MRIGELASRSGLSTRTLRFYEEVGLLVPPPRTSGGYRDYPGSAVARLAFIGESQRAGLTLAEIRSVLTLRDDGQAPCAHVTALIHEHLDDIDRRMAELAATRRVLRTLATRAAATDPAECGGDDICSIVIAGET